MDNFFRIKWSGNSLNTNLKWQQCHQLKLIDCFIYRGSLGRGGGGGYNQRGGGGGGYNKDRQSMYKSTSLTI